MHKTESSYRDSHAHTPHASAHKHTNKHTKNTHTHTHTHTGSYCGTYNQIARMFIGVLLMLYDAPQSFGAHLPV